MGERGRHQGFSVWARRADGIELRHARMTLLRRIALHRGKIQEAIRIEFYVDIPHWEHEVRIFQEQLHIIDEELSARGTQE